MGMVHSCTKMALQLMTESGTKENSISLALYTIQATFQSTKANGIWGNLTALEHHFSQQGLKNTQANGKMADLTEEVLHFIKRVKKSMRVIGSKVNQMAQEITTMKKAENLKNLNLHKTK